MSEVYDIESADVLTSNSEDIYAKESFFNYYAFPSVNYAVDYNLFSLNKLELIQTHTVQQVLFSGQLNEFYSIKGFISISVIQEENQFIGDIPTLQLYAFGDSLNDVIEELKQDIIDLYDELTELPNNRLSENPRKWKAELQKYIVKK